MTHRYLIALGSNRRHPRLGDPRKVLRAAIDALAQDGWAIDAVAPILASRPVGPSQRLYANGAAVIAGGHAPREALEHLQALETRFGRVRRGQRWQARVLDLDIVLWSGGPFHAPGLTVPHPLFRERAFVLAPAAAIAPHWRDPVTGRTLRQLARRNAAPQAIKHA